MRKIFLLRHAQADSDFNIKDHERALTYAGKAQALTVGVLLKNHEINHVLCSSAVRTQETLNALKKAGVQFGSIDIIDRLYNSHADTLLDEIDLTEGNVLIIAHNPGIHQLAFQLAQGGDSDMITRLAMGYPPASLSIFEDGKIIDLISPALME